MIDSINVSHSLDFFLFSLKDGFLLVLGCRIPVHGVALIFMRNLEIYQRIVFHINLPVTK